MRVPWGSHVWGSWFSGTWGMLGVPLPATLPFSPGSLPKWVVNKSSQFLAPKVSLWHWGGVWCGGEGSLCPSHSSSQAMKKMYKACLKYPEWKQKHDPHFKPWLFPEQSRLPALALSELSLQHADSLENIDESSLAESKEDRGEGSDEDSLT